MYVMSYFRTSAEGLHLATSEDGLAWTPLNGNRPILTASPDLGTIRDPHLSRDGDGVYHLVFTSGWAADGIGHCASRDLLHWGEQEYLPVMAGVHGVRNCWALECFHDREAGMYRILWSSTVVPMMRQTGQHRKCGRGRTTTASGTRPRGISVCSSPHRSSSTRATA